ncbi:MAG: TIGR00289 family protein, partial [Nanoarchaeota archaeon]|nr:TIGR00289 family protein [Nanoarchaeota archaeon]
GEYETFVLDCPLFKKKIEIKDFEIKMENECTGQYIIKATYLVKK